MEQKTSELLLDKTIEWNGNEHEIKVFPDGKILIKVSSIYPEKVLNTIDYPSLDYLRKRLKDRFTLAYKYIGKNGEQYTDKIESLILNL